jgi:DNA-binding CsgD family transcriptional regulator
MHPLWKGYADSNRFYRKHELEWNAHFTYGPIGFAVVDNLAVVAFLSSVLMPFSSAKVVVKSGPYFPVSLYERSKEESLEWRLSADLKKDTVLIVYGGVREADSSDQANWLDCLMRSWIDAMTGRMVEKIYMTCHGQENMELAQRCGLKFHRNMTGDGVVRLMRLTKSEWQRDGNPLLAPIFLKPGPPFKMSPQMSRVYALIGQGHSITASAFQLGIQRDTAKDHVRQIVTRIRNSGIAWTAPAGHATNVALIRECYRRWKNL